MARLLVVHENELWDRTMGDWPGLVPPGSLVVLNDTKVVKARLLGKKAKTGGQVEILLVERAASSNAEPSESRWRAIGRGLGDLGAQEFVFGQHALTLRVL